MNRSTRWRGRSVLVIGVCVAVPLALVASLYLFTGRAFKLATTLPPIHQAAQDGNLASLELQVSRGEDINLAIQHSWGEALDGATPLMIAAFHGQREAVAFLMSRGADAHRVDKHGRSARDYAINGGHDELSAMLALP